MRLLVSVRNAIEAEAALAGGADIIDAKEPLNGALGPVAKEVIQSIAEKVAGSAPVSVALGDVGIDDIADGHARGSRIRESRVRGPPSRRRTVHHQPHRARRVDCRGVRGPSVGRCTVSRRRY